MPFPHLLRSLASALVGLMALTACASGQAHDRADAHDQDDLAVVPGPAASDALRNFRSVREPRSAQEPVSISIPAIGIDGPLAKTGLNEDRTLEVPEFGEMSWFDGGTAPGNPGPAAILGHVDSRDGPDVFFRLHTMEAGDEIVIEDARETTYRFVVDRIEQHAKDEFPTEEVWLPSSEPQLRLITCGGVFDRAERSYQDNIIVFASLQP